MRQHMAARAALRRRMECHQIRQPGAAQRYGFGIPDRQCQESGLLQPRDRHLFGNLWAQGGFACKISPFGRQDAAASHFVPGQQDVGDRAPMARCRQPQGHEFQIGARWCENDSRGRGQRIGGADAIAQLLQPVPIEPRIGRAAGRPGADHAFKVTEGGKRNVIGGAGPVTQRGAREGRCAIDIRVRTLGHGYPPVAARSEQERDEAGTLDGSPPRQSG